MELTEQHILGVELRSQESSIFVDSDSKIEEIVKALSSKTRREILGRIRVEPMDVSKIAASLDMTEANISAQIKKLESAGLITCDYESGNHGVRKLSSLKFDTLILKF